jgi:putative sterol carrier protein
MHQTPKEVFESLPRRFNAQGAGDWKSSIQFNLSGDNGGTWHVMVDNGQCNVAEGQAAAPTATVDMPAETWVGISNGTVNPMTAFMKGHIKIKGKMGDVTRLNDPRVFAKA